MDARCTDTLLYTDLVDIYVFTGDSLEPIVSMYNQTNPRGQAGYITAPVNDTWFGTRGQAWNGKNISLPFYWVIQPGGTGLDGSEVPQATFSAVQTTYLDSVSSSIASASSASTASIASTSMAAASSSLASVSSASIASLSGSLLSGVSPSGTSTAGGAAGGGVQSDTGASSFPKWAIGVIVVLGLLAILAGGILAFLCMRRMRRRNEEDSNRGSMGSASPMMANAEQVNSPRSPLLGGGGMLAAGAAGAAGGAAYEHRASSVMSPDGASTASHGGSAGEGGPFSGADAAIMADAFRKALRKPDFAGGIDEGDSPGSDQANNGVLMNRELAEEGRDIRSVESSRGVQVESMSDSGETETAH
ncbi:hypothetical protein HWV62_29581 [Athelia sp. TMB]|nr:hypothetical protein HWV62_29581 [Athelia sp. TMB]